MALGRKTGGRRKGSKNLSTPQIREAFRCLVEGEIDNLREALHEVRFGIEIEKTMPGPNGTPVTVIGRLNADPKGYLDVIAKMAKFCIPELGRIEATGEGGGPIIVEIVKLTEPKP